MIETDGKPTIASKRSDPWLQAALDAGGHLGDDVAKALLEDEKAASEPAVLEIGGWSSKCGVCGAGADPYEREHKTVLSYNRNPGPGCGVRWTHVMATYLGMDERIARMRPDLELIPSEAPFFTPPAPIADTLISDYPELD